MRLSPLACLGLLAALADCDRPAPPPHAPPAGLAYAYQGSLTPEPPLQGYARLFGFRDQRPGPGATEPFQTGASLSAVAFNGHLAPAAPSGRRPLLVAPPAAPLGPVGRLRDGGDYEVYLRHDAPLALLDSVIGALRASGLDARRDPLSPGPALIEARLRALAPLRLGGQIEEFRYDERRAERLDVIDVHLDLRLWIDDPDGKRLYERKLSLDASTTSRDDPLASFGAPVAGSLITDPSFRRAMGLP